MTGHRVDAVIVNWNSRRYLPRCLEALQRATASPHVVVVDNASSDGSVEYLRQEWPQVEVLALAENIGYAAGANRGIQAGQADFAIIMNADVALEPEHLEALVQRMDADDAVGAAQGKLYQISPDEYVSGAVPSAPILDSAGHSLRRTRMVVDRGQGQPDRAAYDVEREVFSACGAALLLRRKMLEDIAPDGEFFDEAFFAYKEDIDLCWRARLLGWKILFVPSAVGYHVRGWAGGKAPDPRRTPLAVRRHSWKNHYLLLIKNERGIDFLRSLPAILGWEVLRIGYALLRDRALFGAYGDLYRLLPRLRAQRREIMRRRRASNREPRRWLGAD